MNILLIYDISEDKLRTKTSETCKDYGLVRVQYSAFYGSMSKNLYGELQRKLKDLLKNSERSSVIIFPLSQESIDKVVSLDFNYSKTAI
ncbi:CRISPR-associated protein Cas2 [Scopulibacillus daqui]|uniref:CRISPR-associated endoribonuclease Cas2 n=1 Tax=Scopulibacillus daqui TaxID=1469162 RepID=A0ABS2PZ14_9BACL|nr:CRISPR-associated endonuclease Cas2 [Scopulibacillus daqui]MBM7644542.1 CRISPR-associated protein Cas2 [Scopulibacillus daqui]